MIWTHGRSKLDKFIEYLNQIHFKIKFTSEVSTNSGKFLDTTVKIDTNQTLYTTLYDKPTDTHLCLHYESAHHSPCHTKGLYGQFLRIRRICSKNQEFIDNGVKMIEHCLKRGYPFKQLKKHMLRACKFTQDELLVFKTKEPTNVPVMTTRFNPTNPDIKKFIHENWNIIDNSNDCYQTFPEKPIVGFKRLANLRDILTKASISYPPPEIETKKIMPTHCTHLGKCAYCPIIKKVDNVTCKVTGRKFHTIDLANQLLCELSDIVYLITCSKCNKYMLVKQADPLELVSMSINYLSQNQRIPKSPQYPNILLNRVIQLGICSSVS